MRVNSDKVPDVKKPYLKSGDVTVVRSGAYTGDIGLVDDEWKDSVAGYNLVITPGDKCTCEFVTWYLLTPYVQTQHFKALRQRAAQSHLNAEQVRVTPFLIPPIHMQQEFAHRLGKVRGLQTSQAGSAHRLDDLFQSLLHRAFEGEQ